MVRGGYYNRDCRTKNKGERLASVFGGRRERERTRTLVSRPRRRKNLVGREASNPPTSNKQTTNMASTASRRGVTIELSPEVAHDLRMRVASRQQEPSSQQQPAWCGKRRRRRPKGWAALGCLIPDGKKKSQVVPDDQDWDCVLMPMDHGGNAILISEEEEDSKDDNDNDDVDDDPPVDDDDDDRSSSCLSYSPPDTLPVVLVDVERLTGYSLDSTGQQQRGRGVGGIGRAATHRPHGALGRRSNRTNNKCICSRWYSSRRRDGGRQEARAAAATRC